MGAGAAFFLGTGVGGIVGLGGNVGIGAAIAVGAEEAWCPTVRRYASTESTVLTITTNSRIMLAGFFNAITNGLKMLTIPITSTCELLKL